MATPADPVAACGFCHWSFGSHAPGCAQCAHGDYAEARDGYRKAHDLPRDSANHYDVPMPTWYEDAEWLYGHRRAA